MNKTFPNFFIIGAAKSGTTSLHEYLSQHPDIYMSRVKETNFFAFLNNPPRFAGPEPNKADRILGDRLIREKYGYSITDPKEYQRLYSKVRNEKAIGESSVSYMYYPEIAARIREQVPEAKLIAILRNPVERAYSKYLQFRRDASEPLVSFDDALAAEPERIRTNWSPTWFYVDRGFYYRQLRPYFDLFGKEKIHILLFEDFCSNSADEVRTIFRFLGVNEDFPVDFREKHNVSKNRQVPRSMLLYDLVMHPNWFSNTAQSVIPKFIVRRIRPVINKIISKDAGISDYTPLTDETRARLKQVFREDIENLQALIDRDLSAWL